MTMAMMMIVMMMVIWMRVVLMRVTMMMVTMMVMVMIMPATMGYIDDCVYARCGNAAKTKLYDNVAWLNGRNALPNT